MRADLHLHTTASDGRLSPAELVQLAAKLRLDVIAITDHDSVEGIPAALAAAQAFPGLRVIPGIEISTDIPRDEVHILGYFIDYCHHEFKLNLEVLRDSRRKRAQQMIAKLRDLGINIEWKRVQELVGNASVGRPHLAQVMLERGYISSLQEAFVKYIGRNCPAYAEREKLTPVEAVELIRKVGGLAVLAHPADIEQLEPLLVQLKKAKLVGIEAYYNGYPPPVTNRLVNLANKYGLIPCGGSDYHGLEGNTGREPGSVEVPPDSINKLIALANKPHQRWCSDVT